MEAFQGFLGPDAARAGPPAAAPPEPDSPNMPEVASERSPKFQVCIDADDAGEDLLRSVARTPSSSSGANNQTPVRSSAWQASEAFDADTSAGPRRKGFSLDGEDGTPEDQVPRASPISKVVPPPVQVPSPPGEDTSQSPSELSCNSLVWAAFRRLNESGSGTISCVEMRALADFTGFYGSDDEWASEFVDLCEYLKCDHFAGVDAFSFGRLVKDTSSRGCYCSDEELRLLLRRAQPPVSTQAKLPDWASQGMAFEEIFGLYDMEGFNYPNQIGEGQAEDGESLLGALFFNPPRAPEPPGCDGPICESGICSTSCSVQGLAKGLASSKR